MSHPILSRAIVAFAALAATPLTAQLRWVDAAPTQSPAPRYGHTASYAYLIFGGRDDVQAFNDTWAYGTDGVVGDTWIPVAGTVRPPARYDHAMGGMATGLLVFGGKDLQGNRFADTWQLSGGWVGGPPHQWIGSWQQVQSAVSPTARTGHAMAYDAASNTQCLMFGGRTDSGLSDETWMFENGQWQQLSLATSPSPREGHMMVAEFDGWYLYGGEDSGGVSSEVWRFDGTSWQKLQDMPFAATDHAMTFVSFERRRYTFVGGRDAAGLRDDLFEYSSDDGWLQQQVTGPLTERRDATVMNHLHFVVNSPNQFRASALAFGGRDANGTVLGDTMRLEATHPADVETISTGCGLGAWGNNGPDVSMRKLVLGGRQDLAVYASSGNLPVFVGVQFGEASNALPCQISIAPDVLLFGVTASSTPPPSFGAVGFPIHAPFDPLLRGAVLSMQSLVFDGMSSNGVSLSGVLILRIGD